MPFSLIIGTWPFAIDRTVETISTGVSCTLIFLSSNFVTSSKSLNNRPKCFDDAWASSRYFLARSSIVAVFGFKAKPKYPSIEATGVRISCDAVEIKSACSPSSSSSRAMSRSVIIRSFWPVVVQTTEIATGLLCSWTLTNIRSRVSKFSPFITALSTGLTSSSVLVPSEFSRLRIEASCRFSTIFGSFVPSSLIAAGFTNTTIPEEWTIITPSSIEFNTKLARLADCAVVVVGFCGACPLLIGSFFLIKLKILIA